MKVKMPVSSLLVIGLFFLFTVNCSMIGQVMDSIITSTPIPTSTVTITQTITKTLTSTKTATQTPTVEPSIKPFNLIGIWKSDDMRAPDNSWNISYSIYLKFTNNKQFVYHGVEAFTKNRPTDEGDLIYQNESTFIKKISFIPDHPEMLGKFQKWTWRFSNGNVLFEIYRTVDSREQALNDTVFTAFSTGVKVDK
jgi:hypothetical protein